MAATSISTARTAPAANTTLRAMVAAYFLFWAALAIAPSNRTGWILEHTPTVAGVIILFKTYRTFPLSNLSYGLLGLFVSLHSIGAHYGYAYVPFGFWIRDLFELSRNHYDRLVHFSFGLLMTYPIRELILRTSGLRGIWANYLPLEVVIATSGFYEVCEMFVAVVISPEDGILFLGTQGDEWDAQKDMGMAVLGTTIAMLAIALSRRLRNRPVDAFH